MSSRSKVLVLCFDPLTEHMPGPAIRAWNLAGQLAEAHEVVLAGTAGATRKHSGMAVRGVSGPEVDDLVSWADVVFAPTSVVRRHPVVVSTETPLCIDMYVPTHLENLEAIGEAGGEEHVAAVAHQVSVINEDLLNGDFFLCASERQRDFWLGSMAALGRINPATYASDPTLRNLIEVVPFGVDSTPPPAERGALRRAFPAIGPDDPVVIWGGGVYNWFDPLSLVRAIDALRARHPTIRLVFLGMRHPNPEIPPMRVAAELRAESDRLALTGTHVFFNDGWVPYDQRGDYLLDADIGVSTHLANVETRFSFRTRVLDYLWTGLPMVLTEGDTLSDEIARSGLGVVVPPGQPAAIADAIDRLLDALPAREAVTGFGARYAWDAVASPVVEYCGSPRRAADRPSRLPPSDTPLEQPKNQSPDGGDLLASQPPDRTPMELAGRLLKPMLRRLVGPRGRQALRSMANHAASSARGLRER